MKNYINIEVNTQETQMTLTQLKAVVTPQRFQQIMWGIYRRTGGHVRKILKTDIPKKYHAKAGDISKAVGNAKTTVSTLGTGCTIPIRGKRGKIGGTYTASGSARGWQSRYKNYRVGAKIVKSGKSTLPVRMTSLGSNQKPFRNSTAKKLNGVAFVREGKERTPIRPIAGIAIPQMPMNRSEDDVQRDIADYMLDRISQAYKLAIGQIKPR